MKTRLVLLNGERAGQKFELEPEVTLIIGREESADITLPERKVSRHHVKIHFDGASKRVSIEDLDSLNGTYVNTTPIEGKIPNLRRLPGEQQGAKFGKRCLRQVIVRDPLGDKGSVESDFVERHVDPADLIRAAKHAAGYPGTRQEHLSR